MAFLGQTFAAENLPRGESDFLAIPAGDYQVTITDASLNDTKSGTGQYIKLRMDITGPSYQGRVLYSNLNIRNQSSKAEEIGLQQLGELMRAAGLTKIEDTDELIGASAVVKVSKVQDANYGDAEGFTNEVKSFRPVAATIVSSKQAVAPDVAFVAPAGDKAQDTKSNTAPPWAKK